MVNSMRILVLTFYFPPDFGAGAFRMGAFVRELETQLPPDVEVDVVATAPNRYSSVSVESPAYERRGNINIYRVAVPGHQSGMADQSRAFAAFAYGAFRITRGKRYDTVLASSSRLFTAYLGALIARRSKARLYLDLRDIFTDTIEDVLGSSPLRVLVPLFRAVERYTLARAERVNLVSKGFQDHFERLDAAKDYRFFPNGIDEEFLQADFSKPSQDRPIRIMYAGNIGAGQGLHRIVPGLAAELGESYELFMIGDGGTRKELEQAVKRAGVRNVHIQNPVRRPELLELYRTADILFMHLDDQDAFAKVLPSKVFEYAATGKPILAGVRGYAAQFIRKEIPNAAVFPPCNVSEAVQAVKNLELSTTHRGEFIAKYRRDKIVREFVADVLQFAKGN